MKDINKLEILIASWYKDVPHLPPAGQKWLASNVWWLALIGVVLGAMGIFGMLSLTLFAGAALVAVGGTQGALLGGIALIAVLVFSALAVACLVVTAIAITPLKAGLKKGWTLLFIGMLINVASLLVSFLTNLSFSSLLGGLLMTAVGVYFLFEIRSHFAAGQDVKQSKPSTKKTA